MGFGGIVVVRRVGRGVVCRFAWVADLMFVDGESVEWVAGGVAVIRAERRVDDDSDDGARRKLVEVEADIAEGDGLVSGVDCVIVLPVVAIRVYVRTYSSCS